MDSPMGACGCLIHVCLGSCPENSAKARGHVCLAHPTATLYLAHSVPEPHLPEPAPVHSASADGPRDKLELEFKDSPFRCSLCLTFHAYRPHPCWGVSFPPPLAPAVPPVTHNGQLKPAIPGDTCSLTMGLAGVPHSLQDETTRHLGLFPVQPFPRCLLSTMHTPDSLRSSTRGLGL